MMLFALYELALREGLLEDPDFEKRRVDFYVRFDDRGRFLALVPTADEDGRAKEIVVPMQRKRQGNATTPHFLFDNAKYVLGIGPKEKIARTRACAKAFREEVAACAVATKDEGVAAAASFLERLEEQLPKILKIRPASEWTGSEWIALVRDADGTRPIHERARARAYWKAKRGQGGDATGVPVRCLVTGEVGEATPTHPNVKRVPQAQTSGAALVSFNCNAFESHGLSQGQNAPVSRAAAEGYVTALNWLLEGTATRPHRYGVRLGDEAVTVFWTREKNTVADYLAAALETSPEDYAKLAEAPFRGLASEATDGTPFYAATLSGNAARVVVRDWFETTAGEVKRSLDQYFEDLRIGSGPSRPVPIWLLLRAVQPPSGRGVSPAAAGKRAHLDAPERTPSSGRGVSPAAAGKLFRSALRGGGSPSELLAAALRRLRLPPDEKEGPDKLRFRCALVKASLIRLSRSGNRSWEVSVSLDESKREVPYLLGRLFAVLERLQGAAQGDINATIRDRWFGAASTTPALAFPRLLRLSVHHAAKAERGGWLEKRKGQIVAALPAEPFPRALSLEDQGLFAVGYYHQREAFFAKREPEGDEAPAAT